MSSIDEIIDYVVSSDVIHEFPSTVSSKLKKFKKISSFVKSGQERILYQSCKRERNAFLELDSDNYMDDYTYHLTIKIIMDVIETNCPYCLESRF